MGDQLQARVAARRGGSGHADGTGTEVAERAPLTLAAQIRQMMPEYQKAMPKGMEATQLVRDGLTCLRTVRKLDQCEPASVLGALMTTAQLGLRPGLLGHAWPLPFWDSRDSCYKAQLVIGYQGFVELGFRSGRLTDISSRVVYWEDLEFSLTYREYGDRLIHTPNPDGLRQKIRCFYSRARLVNGGYLLTDPMSKEAMEAYRDENATSRDRDGKIFGPWMDNLPAMGSKTMVKINFKLLPKSPEMAIAMEANEGVRVDLSPTADAAEVTEHPVVPGRVEPDSQEASGQ